MTVLQVAALVLVAVAGTATVLVREPPRQAIVAGGFGLALTIVFFVFQAPDVALSMLVVSSVALPAMILLATSKTREREEEE